MLYSYLSFILMLAQVISTVLFAVRPEDIALSLGTGKSCVCLGGGGLSLPRYGECGGMEDDAPELRRMAR